MWPLKTSGETKRIRLAMRVHFSHFYLLVGLYISLYNFIICDEKHSVGETRGEDKIPVMDIGVNDGGGGGLSLTVSSDSISGTNIILIGGEHQEGQEDRWSIFRSIRFMTSSNLKYYPVENHCSLARPGRNNRRDQYFSKNKRRNILKK